ncbi:hypothetical protein OE88DRAFT_1661891 [Heliocybe sulcata]|uniref:Uncharacterized protein n=1 Tax=Heliocybe sulcata TaxID=5364 RepID=A0A5C3N1B4_9AGAM|nr:hypothetical protein OE88DRAFT_1661891 [Heliocybe sulcata]
MARSSPSFANEPQPTASNEGGHDHGQDPWGSAIFLGSSIDPSGAGYIPEAYLGHGMMDMLGLSPMPLDASSAALSQHAQYSHGEYSASGAPQSATPTGAHPSNALPPEGGVQPEWPSRDWLSGDMEDNIADGSYRGSFFDPRSAG